MRFRSLGGHVDSKKNASKTLFPFRGSASEPRWTARASTVAYKGGPNGLCRYIDWLINIYSVRFFFFFFGFGTSEADTARFSFLSRHGGKVQPAPDCATEITSDECGGRTGRRTRAVSSGASGTRYRAQSKVHAGQGSVEPFPSQKGKSFLAFLKQCDKKVCTFVTNWVRWK